MSVPGLGPLEFRGSSSEAEERRRTSGSLLARIWRNLSRRLPPIEVEGARYRPTRVSETERTLGERPWRVTLADGSRMTVRASHARIYHDLSPDPRIAAASMLAGGLRPGDRALALGAGTGAVAAWLAEMVGPSGAVVSLEHDRESVRFARRRYIGGYMSLEIGGFEALMGEPDGAFDAVLWSDRDGEPRDAPLEDRLRELRRLLAPHGRLVVATERGPGRAGKLLRELSGWTAQDNVRIGDRAQARSAGAGWNAIFVDLERPASGPGTRSA
ncbi:MAG: methyltransferase domain-containing protein [Planctomycetota bacterium]